LADWRKEKVLPHSKLFILTEEPAMRRARNRVLKSNPEMGGFTKARQV
jgi:hypothetical protein